jgi:hypothetical protein
MKKELQQGYLVDTCGAFPEKYGSSHRGTDQGS